jgi:hypothetical protein
MRGDEESFGTEVRKEVSRGILKGENHSFSSEFLPFHAYEQ